MTNRKRAPLAVLLAALIFCTCFTVFTLRARADEETRTGPTLYVNDEVWYNAEVYPVQYFQSTYVPMIVFEQIEGTTVTFFDNNTAIIRRSETCFLSFDFARDTAMSQKNDRFYCNTKLWDGQRYIPFLTAITQLDLTYDEFKSDINGSTYIRICDGSQTKTFHELLEKYNPEALSVATTPPPATTETTRYIDPITNPAFLAVDGFGSGERIPAILDLLDEYNSRAAFFITPSELTAHPELVLSVIAGGHSLGFLVEAEGATDTLSAANADLMARYHMTTRLVRIADPDNLTPADDRRLVEAGYSRWDCHIDLGPDEASVRAALIAFRSALDEEGHIVLRAEPDGFNTVGYLREFFKSAQGKRLFFPITPAHLALAE